MARQARNGEPLGFEDTLWKAADKLRGSMDSSEYKHVVLGLVFLKYIDDAFAERRAQLSADLANGGITGDAAEELLESRDEYTAEGVFWVPPEARWDYLQSNAKQSEIGKLIDAAMDGVEVENPSLRVGRPPSGTAPSAASALQGLQRIGGGLLPGRRYDSRMAFVDGPHDVKDGAAQRQHGTK